MLKLFEYRFFTNKMMLKLFEYRFCTKKIMLNCSTIDIILKMILNYLSIDFLQLK
jgi:hypothetical protein